MDNCCSGCCARCSVVGDEKTNMKARIEELENICEKLETELADANSYIKMVDSETEEGLYDDDYE